MNDVIAGTAGGIALTLVGHPLDTAKVRLQTQPASAPLYNGTFDCLRKTLQWEGLRGLYKGVASPLMGQVVFRATLFFSYGQATSALAHWRHPASDSASRLPPLDYFIAGGATGLAASLVEGPIDLLKSQMQLEIIRARSQPGYVPRYKGIFHVGRTALQLSGARGLYQGLFATVLRNVPANAVYFGSFELLRTQLAARRNQPLSEIPAVLNFACGSVAGLLYWCSTYPLDVVKSTLMGDSLVPAERRHKSYLGAVKHIYANSGGLTGFYRGFGACCLRAIIANGTIWLTVLQTKAFLVRLQQPAAS